MILCLLFEIIINFKDMTHNLEGICTFRDFHIYSKMIFFKKKHVMDWDNYKHFL
jgi:hypothetical protein